MCGGALRGWHLRVRAHPGVCVGQADHELLEEPAGLWLGQAAAGAPLLQVLAQVAARA